MPRPRVVPTQEIVQPHSTSAVACLLRKHSKHHYMQADKKTAWETSEVAFLARPSDARLSPS